MAAEGRAGLVPYILARELFAGLAGLIFFGILDEDN